MPTIFKRIVDREIPADIVYEDDRCLAFRDVSPQAPTHVLLIPKKEIASTDALSEDDAELVGHMWLVIRNLARQLGVDKSGYRVTVNCGPDGGQSVDHLHFHLLGGRPMQWLRMFGHAGDCIGLLWCRPHLRYVVAAVLTAQQQPLPRQFFKEAGPRAGHWPLLD